MPAPFVEKTFSKKKKKTVKSLCCRPEIDVTLCVNYTSVKKKVEREKTTHRWEKIFPENVSDDRFSI